LFESSIECLAKTMALGNPLGKNAAVENLVFVDIKLCA